MALGELGARLRGSPADRLLQGPNRRSPAHLPRLCALSARRAGGSAEAAELGGCCSRDTAAHAHVRTCTHLKTPSLTLPAPSACRSRAARPTSKQYGDARGFCPTSRSVNIDLSSRNWLDMGALTLTQPPRMHGARVPRARDNLTTSRPGHPGAVARQSLLKSVDEPQGIKPYPR